MKALVVYDSVYGNTEKIAGAIAGALPGEVKLLKAGDAGPSELEGIDLLIVGSPTQGGKPTPTVLEFLDKVPADALKNVGAASFDTRIKIAIIGNLFGYAAGRIARSLEEKGVRLAAPPEGFIVKGNEGPLKEGELERATGWAKGLAEAQKPH